MKLTTPQRAVLADALLTRFRAVVRQKGDAIEMRAAAVIFGVVALFGVSVPTSDAFLTRYWTTLGCVIYTPVGAGPLDASLRVLCHELTHVVQFWRDPLSYVSRYASRKGRAELEAEAERGALEVWWLLTGELPRELADLDRTRHGYALGDSPGDHDDHADLTRDLLETACTSVAQGVISTDVGLYVLSWLLAEAPDAIVGKVHEVVPA